MRRGLKDCQIFHLDPHWPIAAYEAAAPAVREPLRDTRKHWPPPSALVDYARRPERSRKPCIEMPAFQASPLLGFPKPQSVTPRPRRRTPPSMPAYDPPRLPVSRLSDHPAMVGLMLTLCFPIGLSLLWASPRFPREGKIVMTCFVSFIILLASAMLFAR
jgi:hypothetical protein